MILHRLTHVGSYAFPREITLDFTGLPSLLALHGANGSGKTTTLDVITAGLYGQMAYRQGALTRHFATKGHVTLEYELDGVAYRSRLLVDPTIERTEATLVRLDGDTETVLAGPLVRDFRRAAEALIGPLELWLSSGYSVQSGLGAFLRLPRAERKALLVELLGLQVYPRLEAAAKDRARATEATLAGLRARVAELEAQVTRRGALVAQAEALRERLTAGRTALRTVEAAIDAARATVETAQVAMAAFAPVVAQADALARECELLAAQAADLERRRANNAALLRERPVIEAAVAEAAQLQAELATLDADLDAARRAMQVVQETLSRRALVERDLAHARTTRERLARQSGLLAAVPCEGAGPYAGCPLLGDAQAAKATLPQAVDAVLGLEARLAELPTAAPDDPTAALQAARSDRQRRLARLAEQTAKAGPLVAAEARLDELAQAIRTTTAAREAKAAQLEAARAQLAERPDREAALRAAQQELAALEAERRRAAQAIGQLERECGQVEGQLAALDAAVAALADAQGALAPASEDLADWAFLTKAFGPTGIPALLIDQALPELGRLATDLLRECYGEEVFTIALTTQKASTAGDKLLETLDVVVRRGGTPIDAALLSGGEAVLVSEALSLALALYTASRAGRAIQTLLRDEVSAPLDRDRAPAYVRMLRRAAQIGGFRHVLFVSHNEDAIAGADCAIEVGNGCLTVV